MPSDAAHTGSIGVNVGPSVSEVADQTLGNSSLINGNAGEAPSAPNVVESDRGDSYVSDMSGQPGASLIMPGSTANSSFKKEQQSKIFSNEYNSGRSQRQNQARQESRSAIPATEVQDRSGDAVDQLQAQSAVTTTASQQQQQQTQQPAPDGRVVLAPQAQNTSRAFTLDDFSLSEEERNPNFADINIEAPPVADPSTPIEIGTLKHAKAQRVQPVSMDDTVDIVSRIGESAANDAKAKADDNVAEPNNVSFTAKNNNRLATKDVAGSVFYNEERNIKASTAEAVKSKNWTGNGFTEKVTASKFVDPEDVSIGSQIVLELIREPGNNLIQIVNESTGLNFTREQILQPGGLDPFVDAINQATIYVIGSKSPVPNPESSQRRRLRVHGGRGVRVHPTQTKVYNLDFDGDGVTIQFNTDGSLFRGAMDCLINSMNEPVVDLDFFPLTQIAASRNEFIRDFRTLFLVNLSEDINTDALAAAVYDLMYPELAPSGKNKTELTRDLIYAMNDVASNYENRENVLSYILKDIFDTMLFVKNVQVEHMVNSAPDVMSDIIEMPADNIVTMVIQDIAVGNLPPNFQDFLIELGRYIGEVPGKNVMFRLGADVAKRVKFSGTTFKGEEGARELYELTLEAGMAAFMSGRANIGEKIAYVQQIAKREIIRRVGFPSDYQSLRQWMEAFVVEYNHFYSMLDLADIEFGCDLDPVYSSIKDRAIKGDKITDLATPITTVYGDYTVERMFPNGISYAENLTVNRENGERFSVHRKANTLLPRYRRSTLSKLAMDNRIAVNFNEIKNVRIGSATEIDIILAIADKRKSTASKYNKELDNSDERNPGLLQSFTKGLVDFAKRNASYTRKKDKNPADFLMYANDLMACMHISGPDMFAYYGMINPSGFINSYYGDLLQRAANKKKGNVDYVGGVRMTMVVQYRLRNIQNINAEISRLMAEEYSFPLNVPRINELQNRLQSELMVLGSSSDLWFVLSQEIMGNTTAYKSLVDSGGDMLSTWCDANDMVGIDGKKLKFWKKGCKKYNSLTEVLTDPAVPKSEKEAIAADVVRAATGFNELQRHEISYQLEIGPHSNYTTLSTMAYRDQPNVLSDVQKANSKFKQFFENNWQAVQDDVKQARAQSKPGELDSYIKHMADNPQAYLDIDDDIIVDAINAQMDKTSRASEKAHQEIPVTVLYQAIMQQRGGFTNAMYRSDARVLGMMPEKNLTAYDLIMVLADPDMSITVYNGNGRYILSREVLCGDTSEEALWNMIERNPRIASILRPSVASVHKQDVYRNAKQTFQESFMQPRTSKDVLRGKVKAELIDHPMFLSMVAMFKPISGRSSRSLRQETKDVLNSLETLMIGLGKRAVNKKSVSARKVLETMGVTIETLQTIGGMDKTAAELWYMDMADAINRYVAYVAAIIDGVYDGDARAIYDERSAIRLSFDASSVALAVDVRQTMTGAKTEKSTDIEGGMTQDNLGLGLWAMSVEDEFTVIDGDMSDEELSQFVGCMTNAGLIEIDDLGYLGVEGDPNKIGSFASKRAVESRNAMDVSALRAKIEELEMSLPSNVPLIVQMPDGMLRQDKTLSDGGDQIPSVARMAITKRTRGAEDYNLKAKKAGDDGLDSITKSKRYDQDARKNIGIVETVYEQSDPSVARFNAIMKLAGILQSADIAEGYEDMDLADYANIASLMIKEIKDDSGKQTIVIRSLGEISTAIRYNMDQSVVENGTPKEKIDNAAAIADNVGVQAMAQIESMTNMALLSVSSIKSNIGIGSFKPAKNAAMSSPERSFNMLMQLTEPEYLKLPWGGHTKKKGIRLLTSIQLKAKEKALRDRIPFDTYHSNYNFIGVIGRNRDKNGEIKETDYLESPGQTSVWYLTNGATQDEIDFALRHCYAYGMTLAFKSLDALGDKAEFFEKDITPAPFGEDIIMLPFFDMRMNRSAISGPMAPASFQYDPSWLWYSVEDSLNLYGLGDADALISGDAVDKTKCVAGNVAHVDFDDLFFNTRQAYPDKVGPVQLCSKQEILDNIVNWKDGGPTIDFGITDANSNYDRMMEKLGIQLDEYRRNFNDTDDNGFLPESKPDRIVGWVKCYVGNYKNPVYAPIILWPTGTKLEAPTRFEVRDYRLDPGTDAIRIPWRISEDVEGQYCKVHDGMGAAGKTLVAMSRETDLGKLRNGHSIDMVTAAESFASRRLAWGKRMCTLKSLAITIATPPYGYNYAEHPDSFPDLRAAANGGDQWAVELMARLQTERIPIEEWSNIYSSIGKISSDPEIDAMLKKQIELAMKTGTVNPSDILATRIGGQYTFMYVDYDFMFDTSLSFQNTLMKWYNSMQPDVCPPSIDSYYDRKDGKGYLFKPLLEGQSEYDRGCLQMAVPHRSAVTGNIFYHWENVYISFSFFNDDYSGLHKIGLNGANRTMEQLNAMAISGKPLEGRNMQLYTENTAALSSRTYGPNDIELDYGRFLSRER